MEFFVILNNMKPTLFPYQKEFTENILASLISHNKVMAVLPTGAGKTFCFSYIVDHLRNESKRILILVHKEELVTQTVTSLNKMGVVSEAITARTRRVKNFSPVFVAMVETIHRRITKNSNFLPDIDYIIADEAHILIFEKVFELYPHTKKLGFTGTPTHLSRTKFYKCEICNTTYEQVEDCCGGEVMEWSKPFAFSSIYDTCIVGIGVNELIEQDRLVREIPIVKQSIDISGIKTDKDGDFNEISQSKVFSHPQSIDSLVLDYLELCKGKKTMIFTPSTAVNALIYEAMIARGINVKMFDSVNNDEDRIRLVQWFSKNRDAVLINTNVFTTGFDVPDVEAIMLYRATKSLSLYIQIVGRGARVTDKIYKDGFLLVDYGSNIERFGLWSSAELDWLQIFEKGIGEEKAKKENIEAVEICDSCGFMFARAQGKCPNCGEGIPQKKEKQITPEGYKLVPIVKMPPPSGNKIVEYAKNKGEGASFAFKIMTGQILDLFRFYSVTREQYESALASGELDAKLDKMIRLCYFAIIRSGIEGANRRLSTVKDKVKEKISKLYG